MLIKLPNDKKSKIRFLILTISLILFLYQTISQFELYLEYNTDVDIKISRPDFNKYPAISICFSNDIHSIEALKMLRHNSTFNSTFFQLLAKENRSQLSRSSF